MVFCVNSSLRARAWKTSQKLMFNRQLMPLTTNIAESSNITQQRNSSSNIFLHSLTVALNLTIQVKWKYRKGREFRSPSSIIHSKLMEISKTRIQRFNLKWTLICGFFFCTLQLGFQHICHLLAPILLASFHYIQHTLLRVTRMIFRKICQKSINLAV